MGRLEAAARRLEENTGKTGGYRWFQTALADFPNLQQKPAVVYLEDLDSRLAMIEDSLARPRQQPQADAPSAEKIKSLVPPDRRNSGKKKSQKVDDPKQKPDEPPVQDDQPVQGINPAKPAGPPMVAPVALGGAANLLLVVLLGLLLAALVAGLAYVLYSYFRDRVKTPPRQAGPLTGKADDELDDPAKQDPAQLWRQADEKARAGDYLGAVRTIYLAVLAMLHQGGFIRYERTRTNGEYADQLRPRQWLQRPFLGLTGVFEVKWYGERHCESADYGRCRELAEQIRIGSQQRQAEPVMA
jgi:hypothetical protein